MLSNDRGLSKDNLSISESEMMVSNVAVYDFGLEEDLKSVLPSGLHEAPVLGTKFIVADPGREEVIEDLSFARIGAKILVPGNFVG